MRNSLLSLLINLLIGLLFFIGVQPCQAAAPVFSTTFETDVLKAGWTPVGSTRYTRDTPWCATEAHNGHHCLAVVPTRKWDSEFGWKSPAFPVRDKQYYQVTFFSKSSGPFYWYILFYDSSGRQLEGDHYSMAEPSNQWARQDYCFKMKYPAVTATIAFRAIHAIPCYVDDLSITPVTHHAVRAWADTYYASMPRIAYTPPADADSLLPHALQKLKRGGPFRIVVLGDSIGNDLSNSPFDVLLEQKFPRAKIEVRFTGRGGTAWWGFQDTLQERVLQQQPDLLILLAISNNPKNMTQPLTRIITETRAHCPQTDILLITPHFDIIEQKTGEHLGNDLRNADLQFAGEQHLQVLDLLPEWEKYLQVNMKPNSWLLRDDPHMNERGRELIARIVTAYLAQTK